jgi:zinc/manganese transport system substrate-binding protein
MLPSVRTIRTIPAPIAVAALVAGLALVAGGCGEDSPLSSGDASASAVATTTQVADMVRAVGGDRLEVRQLLQPNSDPHGYEPRPSDAVAVADSDLVFQSGGDLDEWLGGLIESSGSDARRVELIQAIPVVASKRHDHGDAADPHWWQDPRNVIVAVAAIRDALIAADPGGRDVYEANASAYAERLRRLDRDVAACIRAIPLAQRKLVTTHDALGYYADRYDIEVVGALIPSRSTAAQPSAGDTHELVDQIEREDVRAIFPESSIDPELERALSRETGATVGRALWADTLGPAGSNGETYVESIQSNTAALVDGLTGGSKRCRS